MPQHERFASLQKTASSPKNNKRPSQIKIGTAFVLVAFLDFE